MSFTTGASSIAAASTVALSFLIALFDDLDVAVVVDVVENVLQCVVGVLAVVLVDGVAQRVFAGDDREDVVAGDELQIVDDAQVGRIGHRDGERAALALEREHQMALRQLGRDQLRDACVDFEVREVDGGHTELPGQHARELDLVDVAELDEVVADPHSGGLLLLQRAIQRLARDEPLSHEEITDALTRAMRCWSYGHDSRRGEQRPSGVGDATRAGSLEAVYVLL